MITDDDINKLVYSGIEMSKNFREDFNEETILNRFLDILDEFLNDIGDPNANFSNSNLRKFQKGYIKKRSGNGLDNDFKYTDILEERDLAWERKRPARIILDNSPYWSEELKKEMNDSSEQQSNTGYDPPLDGIWPDMDRFITLGTKNQFDKGIPDYYKNFMPEKDWKTYEDMLEFIKNELILFSKNLAYLTKIVPALDEYSKRGMFPTQTIFLNHYTTMAVLDMVSVTAKMFTVTNGKKNFGFTYLENWIRKNYHQVDEVKNILTSKKHKDLMNEGKSYRDKFENIRNHYIAHYDPDELDVLKKFSIKLEDLERMYDICVNTLEMLSFKYFHRHEQYGMFIKEQGFKFICHNPYVSSVQKCDLDYFLEELKKYEVKG
ncbi:MAG: hypothetical protein E7232_10045 [Lachnospiraceae bacterium]|nr:hypothetical protein [Lachnospiraceae bacterium]